MIEEVEEREVIPNKTLGSLNGDLISLIEALQDLAKELEPQLKKITAEVSPALNMIKANIDRDETLLLVERLTANTGTLLELVTLLEAAKDLASEFEPQLKKITSEVSPILNHVKANLDKDETILLLERLAANTGTFLELITYLEATRDLLAQIEANKSGLAGELSPKLNMLRKFIDDDDTWTLLGNMHVIKKPVVKLVDELVVTDESGETSAPLVESSISTLHKVLQIVSTPLVLNVIENAATAITEAQDKDIKPVSPLKMYSALKDKDIQRAVGFLFYVLKRVGQSLKA